MTSPHVIDPAVTVGHTHLKVSDIDRSLTFWRDVLGLEVMAWYGTDAVFLSAGGYHHHIALNTWMSKGAAPGDQRTPGLFHVALLFPTRAALAVALRRLIECDWPIDGAADHGVSEAIYLKDPDENGVELYWDRPREQWPLPKGENRVAMQTLPLDLDDLLRG